MDANHEAVLGRYETSQVVLVIHLIFALDIILSIRSSAPSDTLYFAWFFKNLNVKAEELTDEIVLNDFLIVEKRLFVQFDPTLQLTIF